MKHTQGKLKLVSMKYDHEPNEIIIGVGIDITPNYHEVLFNTVLPDSDEEYIKAHPQIKADAERLVMCWNNHDKLVQSLGEMITVFTTVGKMYPSIAHQYKFELNGAKQAINNTKQ